jgi:hypothetical protein
MYTIITNPNGTLVFASGTIGPDAATDFLTIAYDAATGAVAWWDVYHGGFGRDVPHDVAVSPNGTLLMVTGNSDGGPVRSADFLTIAYNTTTGRNPDGNFPWIASSNRAINSYDNPLATALSPNGTLLFVTGPSQGEASENNYRDYWTVAYNAADHGAEVWNMTEGPQDQWDESSGIAVTPNGTYVFVTGRLGNGLNGTDVGTVRYNADDGTGELVRYVHKTPFDYGEDLAISPDGSRVFATGHVGELQAADMITVAYNATNFAEEWNATYNFGDFSNPPYEDDDHALWVLVHPDSEHVFVAGSSKKKNPILGVSDLTTRP